MYYQKVEPTGDLPVSSRLLPFNHCSLSSSKWSHSFRICWFLEKLPRQQHSPSSDQHWTGSGYHCQICLPIWGKGTPPTCGWKFSAKDSLLWITAPSITNQPFISLYIHGHHGVHIPRRNTGKCKTNFKNNETITNSAIGTRACPWCLVISVRQMSWLQKRNKSN